MKKVALGLFHFNVQNVAGELSAYHRYCAEVVLPFLRAVAGRKDFRLTFEMAGNGLEFLADNYPAAIDLLRSLIADEKIELVSSTYAPTLWVAFPRRDLEHSIKLNQKVLERLGLRASRIFFAQEGFFGSGLEVVSDWFEIAICKDDTLRMCANRSAEHPAYQLGKLTVVIGANNLLNELGAWIVRTIQAGKSPELSSFYEAHIQEGINFSSHSLAEYIDGTIDGLQWHWYHLGDAHHFTTTAFPQNWESFFCDPGWMALTCEMLEGFMTDGYQLGFISEFVRHLAVEAIEPLPKMIEGSWNPKRSRGVYVWMGRQEQHWQGGAALLTLAWRARKALRESEARLDQVDDFLKRQKMQQQVDDIWKQQILAESSDPLGWSPLPCEVNFGREQGDRVLQMCATLRCGSSYGLDDVELIGTSAGERMGTRIAKPIVTAELLGTDGTIEWRTICDSVSLCEARFRVEEHVCGIRFKRTSDDIAYCPSGSDQKPVDLVLERFQESELYLPLANGFISLNKDLHLIRDNCSVAVAARVSKREPWVTFAVEGAPEGRLYEWRFIVFQGPIMSAVCKANEVNSI